MKVDARRVLTSLRVPIEREDGDEIYAHCPGHTNRLGRADRNSSWSINVSTGQHNCFSCGYRGNVISLVVDVLDLRTPWDLPDYDAAKAWLSQTIGVNLAAIIADSKNWGSDDYLTEHRPTPMTPARLAIYTEPPDWALSERGLTREAVQHYGVLWNITNNYWILPLYDPEGTLIGFQEKGQRTKHFKNRPTNMRKSLTLFGIQVWQPGPMIVVESPLDAVRLHSVGLPGGVATCGTALSEAQILLMRSGDRLTISMDNPHTDPAGRVASERILQAARLYGFDCWFYAHQSNGPKDIGDSTDEQILFGVENARYCLYGRIALTPYDSAREVRYTLGR